LQIFHTQMIKSVILFIALNQVTPSDTVEFVSPAEIIIQGTELEKSGNYEKAAELYLTVSESDTSYVQVQSKLMSAYNSLKKFDEAIVIGEKLKNSISDFRNTIYITLGNAYLNKENIVKSKNTYNEGLKLFPNSYILMYNLGIAFHRSKEYEKAVECFQKSLHINPYYSSNHLMLGYISMLQGHITKSFLSYMTYLAINPSNNGTLIFLNNLASNGVRSEGSIKPFIDNSDFEYYDDLIRSKAALDSRFKQRVDFNANIVKQSELLLSKLKYEENSDDFWMKNYVPFYTTLQNNDLSAAFIYYILKSTDNKEILNWLEKHDKENSSWIRLINNAFSKNRDTSFIDILGVKDHYSNWFFNNNSLSAIGNQISDDVRIGPWQFYSINNQLNATGKYNEKGEKIGEWIFYHDNGQTSRKEYYNDHGQQIKPAIYYHENGTRSIIANYNTNDELDGQLEYYYKCGQIKEIVPYKNGVKTGKGQVFFENGDVKVDYYLKDSELEGDHISYYKNGQISNQYSIVSGKSNGMYYSYYMDGQLEEEGNYDNDSLSGEWVGYHPNGKIRYKGTFLKGKRVGKWIDYHTNGEIKNAINYGNKGKRNGESNYFNEFGILYNTETYKNDRLISYQFFDEHKNILHQAQNDEGNMEYKSFYFTGEIDTEATLVNGKLNGELTKYHKNGTVYKKANMVDDNYHGIYEEFYPNGQTYTKFGYDNGKLHGYYKLYFKNGAINAHGWYYNDQQEQLWKIYFPDGSLDEERYYISGKLNGKYKVYAPEGKIQKVFEYDEDIITSMAQYDTLGNIYHEQKYEYGNGIRTLKTVAGDTLFKVDIQCGEFASNIYNLYSNGQTESQFVLKNGLYQGDYLGYLRNGKLEAKGKYLNNEQNGLWQWYHSNGVIAKESMYTRDLLEGEVKNYYYNGQIEISSLYADGELTGARKYFDQSGELQLLKIYNKGELVAYVNIKTNDTIDFDRKGKFILESYFKNGKLAATQSYLNGRFDGNSSFYNSNGTLIESTNHKNSYIEGDWIEYYANGNIFVKTPFQNDLKNGIEHEYYENGVLKRSSPYTNDKLNGTEIVYNTNGTVQSKTYYWNGDIY